MASLIEQLRQQNKPALQEPSLVGQLRGQTADLERTAKAQQFGAGAYQRAAGRSAFNPEEEAALLEAGAQEQELSQAGQMQAAKVGQAAEQQEQQFQFQAQDLEERSLNQRMELSNQASQILSQFSRETTRMELAETKAALEFSSALTRLSMEDYTERLQLEGRRNRLDDEVSFREAVAEAVFADEREMLISDLNFRSILNADKRAHAEWIASFDLEQAIRIAETDAAQNAAIQKYGAITEGTRATASGASEINSTFNRKGA